MEIFTNVLSTSFLKYDNDSLGLMGFYSSYFYVKCNKCRRTRGIPTTLLNARSGLINSQRSLNSTKDCKPQVAAKIIDIFIIHLPTYVTHMYSDHNMNKLTIIMLNIE